MKIVAFSDTHGMHHVVSPPDGDVLIFAGDGLRHGSRAELIEFNSWLGTLSHPRKLYVAGNHDRCFETHGEESREILTNAIYLQDGEIVIDGVKFYGSPWTPNYYNWALMLQRRSVELAMVWRKVPKDTDVLITHGPPYGILDVAMDEEKSGDEVLQRRVAQLNLQAHVFGHMHGSHGQKSHGETTFYNVAICDEQYSPVNPVTTFEVFTRS